MVTSTGTYEPFTTPGMEPNLKLSSSGGGLFDERPVTLNGVGALSFFRLGCLILDQYLRLVTPRGRKSMKQDNPLASPGSELNAFNQLLRARSRCSKCHRPKHGIVPGGLTYAQAGLCECGREGKKPGRKRGKKPCPKSWSPHEVR